MPEQTWERAQGRAGAGEMGLPIAPKAPKIQGVAKKNLQIIDIVRTFSILPVLILHQWDRALPPRQPFLRDLWTAIADKGYFGVSLFFVVSGFLITRLIDSNLGGLERPDLKRFYVRRVARIWPLLALVVAVGITVVYGGVPLPPESHGMFTGSHYSLNGAFWLALAAFMFNWLLMWRQSGLNGYGLHWDVLWSIAIEEQFYLLYPWVLRALGSRRRLGVFLALVFALGLAAQGAAYLYRPNDLFLSFMNSFTGFEEISIGALLYLAVERFGKSLSGRPGLCAAFCLLGGGVMAGAYFHPYADKTLLWTPTLLDLGLFLFLLGGIHLSFFESKLLTPLSLPGKVSYGMYLWHASVLSCLLPLMVHWDTWTAFLVFASATFAWAYLSYRFFEVPVNHWVRRRLGLAG